MNKKNILVLCTGNSCRSQIAEAYLRKFAGDQVGVYSAGIERHGLNPRAVATMREDGLDISRQTSNTIQEYADLEVDFVITVCDNAREQCPYFPAQVKHVHQAFPDPARATGSEEEIAEVFRNVREQIKAFCREFVAEQGLAKSAGSPAAI